MADTHTHRHTHTHNAFAQHAIWGTNKAKAKTKAELIRDMVRAVICIFLIYVIQTLSFICAEDDIATAGSSSNDKGEKMDENYEKDALRLLDKSVKREIKKVRSALIAVPVQIWQTTA